MGIIGLRILLCILLPGLPQAKVEIFFGPKNICLLIPIKDNVESKFPHIYSLGQADQRNPVLFRLPKTVMKFFLRFLIKLTKEIPLCFTKL